MVATNHSVREAHFELFLGRLLRTGVLLAASVVLAGGVLYLIRHGSERAENSVFHGEPANLRSPSGIVKSALQGSARGVIQLGLLILVATPVARVILSMIGFVYERDFTYIMLTLIVLAVLVSSLLFGERAASSVSRQQSANH